MKPIVNNYRYILEQKVMKYPDIKVVDDRDICVAFKLKEKTHIDSIPIIKQRIIHNKQFKLADIGPIEWNPIISYR